MKQQSYKFGRKEYTEKEISEMFKPEKVLQLNRVKTRKNVALEFVEGKKVLDVGCGTGIFSYFLASKGKDVIGIDMLPEHITIANRMYKLPNLQFKVMDAANLNFPDNSFDCVLFLETIEHVDNPVEILKDIYRVLKPGGCLVVSTPNSNSYISILQQMFIKEKRIKWISDEETGSGTEQDHLYSWDVYTLYRLLHRCNFEYTAHKFVGVYGLGPFRKLKLSFLSPLLGRFCAIMVIKVKKRK